MKPAAAFLAAVLAAAPLPSLGQATPAPAVPSHSCAKPEFPGRVAPQPKLRCWQADFQTYMVDKYSQLPTRNSVYEAMKNVRFEKS